MTNIWVFINFRLCNYHPLGTFGIFYFGVYLFIELPNNPLRYVCLLPVCIWRKGDTPRDQMSCLRSSKRKWWGPKSMLLSFHTPHVSIRGENPATKPPSPCSLGKQGLPWRVGNVGGMASNAPHQPSHIYNLSWDLGCGISLKSEVASIPSPSPPASACTTLSSSFLPL